MAHADYRSRKLLLAVLIKGLKKYSATDRLPV